MTVLIYFLINHEHHQVERLLYFAPFIDEAAFLNQKVLPSLIPDEHLFELVPTVALDYVQPRLEGHEKLGHEIFPQDAVRLLHAVSLRE